MFCTVDIILRSPDPRSTVSSRTTRARVCVHCTCVQQSTVRQRRDELNISIRALGFKRGDQPFGHVSVLYCCSRSRACLQRPRAETAKGGRRPILRTRNSIRPGNTFHKSIFNSVNETHHSSRLSLSLSLICPGTFYRHSVIAEYSFFEPPSESKRYSRGGVYACARDVSNHSNYIQNARTYIVYLHKQ